MPDQRAKVVITGVLARKDDLKTTQSGTEAISFSVAVNTYNKKTRELEPTFFNCWAYGKMAQKADRIEVGDGLMIFGNIKSGAGDYKNMMTVFAEELLFGELSKKHREALGKGEKSESNGAVHNMDEIAETLGMDLDSDLPF